MNGKGKNREKGKKMKFFSSKNYNKVAKGCRCAVDCKIGCCWGLLMGNFSLSYDSTKSENENHRPPVTNCMKSVKEARMESHCNFIKRCRKGGGVALPTVVYSSI